MKKRLTKLENFSMRVKLIDGCSKVQVVVLNHITDETMVRVIPLDFSDEVLKVSDCGDTKSEQVGEAEESVSSEAEDLSQNKEDEE